MDGLVIRRLRDGDEAWARELFEVFSDVFEVESEPLPSDYVTRLLNRSDMCILVALAGDRVLGGLTAHELPMTRCAEVELFIYDLAVDRAHQRRGIGRALVSTLRESAAAQGIRTAFVPADDEDTHALDFYRAIGGEASPVTLFVFSRSSN